MPLLLNNQLFHLAISDLPCIIHGRGKTGASFFTMNLVLDLLDEGHSVIFYSAFTAARDFLVKNVAAERLSVINNESQFDDNQQLLIPMSGDVNTCMKLLRHRGNNNHIFVVKNIEELEPLIVEEILRYKNVVVSGDCGAKELKDHPFNSKIVFSDFHEFTHEQYVFDQYQGCYVGKGIVSVHTEV